jgi:hypothetical protein
VSKYETPSASGTDLGSWQTSKSGLPNSSNNFLYACSVQKAASGIYSNWGTPELIEVYNNDGIDRVEYATYYKLTQGGEDGLYYENGELLINATNLYVADGNSVIFSANAKNNFINMGGFTIGRIGMLGTPISKSEAFYYGLAGGAANGYSI